MRRPRAWLPFEEARTYVHSLHLPTQRSYYAWAKTAARPPNIPSNPQVVYLLDFRGWGDWLGNGKPQSPSFRHARGWHEYK